MTTEHKPHSSPQDLATRVRNGVFFDSEMGVDAEDALNELVEQFETLEAAAREIYQRGHSHPGHSAPNAPCPLCEWFASSPASAPGNQSLPASGDLSVSGSSTSGDVAESVTPAMPGAEESSRGSKPRLLDLFCGAGGAAMGYHRAGFDVVGVDIKPQPNYPFKFIQGDALTVLRDALSEDNAGFFLAGFDAIHASPPCQAYSNLGSLNGNSHEHPDLIGPTRELLEATGLPYVIENVVGRAPLKHPFKLCGSSFGLRVWRHRLFETDWPMGMIPPCSHHEHTEPLDVTGTGGPGGRHRKPASLAEARNALGIDWMTRAELSEAIPPAYTEFIGTQLMAHLKANEFSDLYAEDYYGVER